jgi:hypothetical protein
MRRLARCSATAFMGLAVSACTNAAVQPTVGNFVSSNPYSIVSPEANPTQMEYLSVDGGQSSTPVVYGLDRMGRTLITITGPNPSTNFSHPQGLFIDRHKNLWVTDQNGTPSSGGAIYVFAHGATSAFKTLQNGKGPTDVTVCPNGMVFVADSSYGSQQAAISVYAQHGTKPIGTLQVPNETQNGGVTCDANNNVFTITYSYPGNGQVVVDEYVGGQESGLKVLPITVTTIGCGIKYDLAGNIIVCDTNAKALTEYTEAGVPTGKSVSTGTNFMSNFAVRKDGGQILVALLQNPGAQEWSFPGGKPGRTFGVPGAQAAGAAYSPSQAP